MLVNTDRLLVMKFTVAFAVLIGVAVVNSLAEVLPKHGITKDWYEGATFYQIYPRSFADSDGNGIGDLRGIIDKLPYLKELGITGTWLSPIFKSPMADFGYDIADFYRVDEMFGTMDDLEELFRVAEQLGIKVILDFVPNHSSDECEWFLKSVKREGKYTDYYIWHDGKIITSNGVEQRAPPNNWNSVFRGSAWTFNEERGQYYLHQFTQQQPDLNYRNPMVIEEMQNVLKFWLAKGAAGFRVDIVNFLIENINLPDEPVIEGVEDKTSYDYLQHIYTQDQAETFDIVYAWRDLLDQWKLENGGETRIMMTESWSSTEKLMPLYGSADGKRKGSHMPFNFVLITDLNEKSTADDFRRVITERLAAIPSGQVVNWVMGNHDVPRVGSRYGRERIDVLMTLVMTLPGIAVTYNGDEIGMMDNRDGITYEQTVDPPGCNAGPENYKAESRDPERTPFQWDDTQYAGFSNGTVEPWLPVHPNYKWLNLKHQRQMSRSTFAYYKELMQLRNEHVILDGSFEPKVVDGKVLTYIRAAAGHGEYLVLLNFAEHEIKINVNQATTKYFTSNKHMQVVIAGADSAHRSGNLLDKSAIVLRKFDAVILKSSASMGIQLSIAVVMAVIGFHIVF